MVPDQLCHTFAMIEIEQGDRAEKKFDPHAQCIITFDHNKELQVIMCHTNLV